MPERNGWTITVEKGGGLLTDGRVKIVFGKKKYARDNTGSWARVDLTKMAHGDATRDTKETTVPRFIAAADRIANLFASGSQTVTVNCANGNSRTSFALIVYLIRHADFSWEDASGLVAEGQALREDITFNLNAVGHNGKYSDWVKEFIAERRLARKPGDGYMSAHSGVTMDGNKTVFMVYDKWPRTRKRALVEDTNDEEAEELDRLPIPPAKRRKPRIPEAEQLNTQARRFLRGSPSGRGYTRSGKKFSPYQ